MKEVKTNQCDFCTKTSFNKGSIRVHEKKCFYNPGTHSCATCLWYSKILISDHPARCFMGEKYVSVNEFRTIFKTKCCKWINAELIEDIEIFDNEHGILDHLLAGDMEVLNIIASIKANGSSYYNKKTDPVQVYINKR
jgi:hypothetical protein